MKPFLPPLLVFGFVLTTAVDARQLAVCDATIRDTPDSWEVVSTEGCHSVLKKRFEQNGHWYDEGISIQAATDNYDQLQGTLKDLYDRYNFRLVDRARLAFGELSAPFWIMYKSEETTGEAIWLALVLHRGLTYSVEMRANPLDTSALTEFGQILAAFRFVSDDREQGWAALAAGNGASAERHFSALLNSDRADANARYGYGLALLAQGDARGAAAAIEQARPQLGVMEDARRALGRAALERGQINRAVAFWIQVIRDNPAQEQEIRPWILAALSRAPIRASDSRQPDLEALINDGGVLLFILRTVERRNMLHEDSSLELDEDGFNATRADISSRLAGALDDAGREPDKPVDMRALLSAVDLERGAGIAATALFGKWDDDTFSRAELLIATSLRDMSTGSDATR